MQLSAGQYIARVQITNGQYNLADRLSLVPSTPVNASHWSSVKALY